MKTKIIREKFRVSLVLDDPTKKRGEYDVVAAMTLYEGTGCWQLVDVRLGQYMRPHPYAGGLSADHFHASHSPDSPEEAEFVKLLLREYVEDKDGSLHWCSFEGIVRGQPTVKGYAPPSFGQSQAGYFSQKDGLAKLKEIQEFWESYEGSPAAAKVDNPHRQPTQSSIMSAVIMKKMAGELPDPDSLHKRDGLDTPAPPF